MGRSFLIILFLGSTLFSIGQKSDTLCFPDVKGLTGRISGLNMPRSDSSKLYICYRKRGDTSDLPLFIVNGLKTNHLTEFISNTSTFKSIDVLNREEALKQYGDKAKYGAIIIKISDSVKLISLNNLLNKYNIKLQDQTLPICIDEDFILNPENIRADLSSIKNVEVKEGKYWFYTSQISNTQRFINISTNR